jgi:predicted metal-dependent enzyme (double-stranded beta helix superfamily)
MDWKKRMKRKEPIMDKKQNALERFIEKTRALFARESDPEKRWTQLSPILAELLADPEVKKASQYWPDCVPAEGRAENLLFYEDPDYGFVVNGLTKAPQTRTQIHDHAHNWTLYGVLDGTETIMRYERVDDKSKFDYAEIRGVSKLRAGPGQVDLVRPWEIHAEASGEERTVAIIVRAEKAGEFLQGRYDPVNRKYWQGYGPIQVPYTLE